jgi:hypothetical protein
MWAASVGAWCPTFEDNVVVSFSRVDMSKKILLGHLNHTKTLITNRLIAFTTFQTAGKANSM